MHEKLKEKYLRYLYNTRNVELISFNSVNQITAEARSIP